MQKHLRILFFGTFILAIMASCSKSNKEGVYIPKTAAVVLLVNGESLNGKLPWSEVKNSEIFKQLYTDTSVDAVMKTALDNPENTGIDVKDDLLLIVQKDTAGGYAAFEGKLQDEAKFKQFIMSAHKGYTASEKDGTQFLMEGKSTVSWKSGRFIILTDLPELNDAKASRYYQEMDSMPAPATPTVFRDGKALAVSLFNLKEDNSLANDEKFTELMKQKADLHFWFNGQTFANSAMSNSPLAMLNVSKLTDGSIVAGTANFENGKIIADLKSYSGKELTELWKKYSGSNIDKDMIKRLPSKNIAAMFALNFKPEGIRELLKLTGMEGFANMGTAKAGFTIDDFIKANKGDIVFSVSDIKKDSSFSTDVNVLFATGIGDKAAFAKLVNAGKMYGASMGSMGVPPVFFSSNDNYFAIGSKKESVDQYIAGGAGNDFPFLNEISGSPAGGYVNFQYILNSMKEEAGQDSIGKVVYNASLQMWDNMIIKGGTFKDGGINQHFEINLVDKNTNSLKQLNNYLGLMAAMEKKKQAKRAAAWSYDDVPNMADSSVVR